MARYIIPNYKMPELRKQIQRIRNKGAHVTFDILNDHVAYLARSLGDNVTIDCSEVEVEGRYEINGWSFVGTIEHASPTNIIRLADLSFSDHIPERYRSAGRDCEHCHIRRDRNDTYLVYNDAEDEFKQVGKTCLRGYTGGLDAEACATLASVMAEVEKMNNAVRFDAFDPDFAEFMRRNYANHLGYPMDIARKKAYTYVQTHGYTTGVTGQEFATALANDTGLPEASEDDVEQVTTWLQNSESNDYIRNALAAWTKDDYKSRDAGLITSAVSSYFKWREREAARVAREAEQAAQIASRDNTFAGNVGDTVELTIREVRVAYYRSGGMSYYGVGREYPVYRILGTDNRIYIWGCSSGMELNVGDKLAGKVKKQITRPNGEIQTEVTRCKVTPASNNYRGFFR